MFLSANKDVGNGGVCATCNAPVVRDAVSALYYAATGQVRTLRCTKLTRSELHPMHRRAGRAAHATEPTS